jgi:polyribonucleotide nucleotidyltransferase
MGDMDFKVAGSRKGLTSFQADIKIRGLPLKILMESLVQANDAKNVIIGIMNKVISLPRSKEKDNMPVIETIEIPLHLKGKLLGVGGSNIKKIFVQTGVHVSFKAYLNFICQIKFDLV